MESLFDRPSNLSPTERWVSLLAGAVLTISAARGGGLFARLGRSAAGLPLLARGFSGHCAVKAAINENLPALREMLPQLGTGAKRIDSMASMYVSELQELHSAERQLSALSTQLAGYFDNPRLVTRATEYASELQAREAGLKHLLVRYHASSQAHPDQGIRALIAETQKMTHVCTKAVRDAALTASLQRIIHYKIAGYGTISAYAKLLGRFDEAAHFAALADRDKAIDAELSEFATNTLNPDALMAPQPAASISGSSRPH
jgi:ferritin-like metal-binding protein YciE